jgi:hypothetical protein
VIYLASPYSDPNALVRWRRFISACAAAGDLIRKGNVVYSPIAHSHPIATECRLPTQYSYWGNTVRPFMAMCDRVVVLKLPGWDGSVGIKEELKIAKELGKEIGYMEWGAARPLQGM